MITFEARYANSKNGLEFTREIKVRNLFSGNEKYCYLEAVSKAYDLAWEDESLISIRVLNH